MREFLDIDTGLADVCSHHRARRLAGSLFRTSVTIPTTRRLCFRRVAASGYWLHAGGEASGRAGRGDSSNDGSLVAVNEAQSWVLMVRCSRSGIYATDSTLHIVVHFVQIELRAQARSFHFSANALPRFRLLVLKEIWVSSRILGSESETI